MARSRAEASSLFVCLLSGQREESAGPEATSFPGQFLPARSIRNWSSDDLSARSN